MIFITKEILTETAHRLLKHTGACHNLHGHTYKWQVTLKCDVLDKKDMLLDFSDLKRLMLAFIVKEYDHACVLNAEDPLVKLLGRTGLHVTTLVGDPTAEAMAIRAYHDFAMMLNSKNKHGATVSVHKVAVWETPTSFACCK